MRINAFSDVCLRVVMLLCAAPESVTFTSRVVAAEVGTPYNHVSKALLKLRELGLIEAIRGRSGGVRISALGRAVTVGSLLRQLDTRTDLAACESPNGPCPLLCGCGLRGSLRRARDAFYRELDGLVISTLPHGKPNGPVLVELGLVR
ncbi:RrF2 family transcriptional regulator [Cryobacterium luteum]|uniref:Rrf2 family transcriptional regulator n=1 Tax=Cryobacterium luteum TaxID=1424661 RepID=A0A1H8E9Q8_9MICO|nr:Rrf2 family transcriptional regulator [Cryobacterium luteum]TFB89857.1 Rrf2 family transcriptional regulator [Cryobacterium luteum]SEN16223.1 transcriptional regulator, BadM/Rrf2 family [Cryobacterium luteum]